MRLRVPGLPGVPGRRKRRPRPDAPRTLIPEAARPAEPLDGSRLDAARSRLRAAIPPRPDDE